MKIWIFAFLLTAWSLNGLIWQPPATISSETPVTSEEIFGAYNPYTHQMFASWVYQPGSIPIAQYSTFTQGGGWATPLVLGDGLQQPSRDIVLAFNPTGPNANEMVAAFTDSANNSIPNSYFYTSSWGSPVVIDNAIGSNGDVFLAFDSVNQLMYAVWTAGSGQPQLAFCNNNTPTWTLTNPPFPTTSPLADVTIVCDNSGNLFAAWPVFDGTANVPNYAIFNGTSWIGPNPISNSYEGDVQGRVCLTYDPVTNQVFAAWGGVNRSFTYSIFANGAWSNPVALPPDETDVVQDVFLTCTPSGQVFASWTFKANSIPYYGIYNQMSESWTLNPITTNPSFSADSFVTLAFSSEWNAMFAFWDSNQTAVWTSVFVPPAPQPVSNLKGGLVENDFGTESELFVRLSWSYNAPAKDILGFKIYENGKLIDTVGPNTFQFIKHSQIPGVANTFTVTAFNIIGEGPPVSVIVK